MDQFKLMDSSMFFVFRLSQKIEPGTSTPRANASKEDLVGKLGVNCGIIISTTCFINLTFFLFLSTGQEASASPLCGRKCTIAAEGNKVPATPPSPRNLLPYGHRKCHSLGYKSVFLLIDDENDELLYIYIPVLSFKVFLFSFSL